MSKKVRNPSLIPQCTSFLVTWEHN